MKIGHMTTAGTPKYDVLENRNIPTKGSASFIEGLKMKLNRIYIVK